MAAGILDTSVTIAPTTGSSTMSRVVVLDQLNEMPSLPHGMQNDGTATVLTGSVSVAMIVPFC